MYHILSRNLSITIGFLLFLTIVSLIFSLNLTQGNFTYALDDPYIHMSTVKHFAEQGIWSVDGNTYASASSSPLWVLLLTPFYLLFGAKLFVYIPFLLNVVFQIISLGLVFKIVKKYTNYELHYIFGITIVLFTPFIALSFGGMEHSLQIFLVLYFINYLIAYVFEPNSKKIQTYLLVLAPLVVFVRYEDFALIMVVALIILFYFKNWKLSFNLILASLSLVIIFGLWSNLALNLGFVPSSIMAKSIIGNELNIMSQLKSILGKFVAQFLQPHIIALYVLNALILVKSYLLNKKFLVILTVLFISTLFIHLALAKLGWLYRYEAYLIIFALLNIFIYIYTIYELNIKWAFIILLFIFPIFLKQVIYAPFTSILGTKNIYEQQIQMANFLHQQCDTCSIAANDIGAITYFTNIHLLDMYGLGSYEVIEHKKNGTYTNEVKNDLLRSKNVSLVIVYDNWFKNITLDNYTKIAEWKIQNNKVCGGDTVSFYSRHDEIDKNFLKVKNYSKNNLPQDVIVSFVELK